MDCYFSVRVTTAAADTENTNLKPGSNTCQ